MVLPVGSIPKKLPNLSLATYRAYKKRIISSLGEIPLNSPGLLNLSKNYLNKLSQLETAQLPLIEKNLYSQFKKILEFV